MKIALIGAGVAGAACASVLRLRGTDFCVYEKSRGPGGRLSTRRVSGILSTGDLHYDHGAPAFHWSNQLSSQLNQQLNENNLRELANGLWVACPSMPQLVKDLLGKCALHTQVEIDALEGSAGNWFLREKPGPDLSRATLHGPFSAVVLTAPAPQTRALLRNVECSWKSRLEEIKYDPCWVLMASFHGLVAKAKQPSKVFTQLVSQNEKPGRNLSEGLQSWVGYTTSEWSRAHLEDDASIVQETLLAEMTRILGLSEITPIHAAVHRWRYSTVAQPLLCTALADTQQALFFASDACAGTGVAGALESGLAVGRRLTETSV